MTLRGAAAVVGFHELPTRRAYPGRSMLGLLGEAAREAIADAHLRKEDIDGLITEGGPVFPADVAQYLGMTPRFATGVSMMGCSGATGITVAAMAVQNGLANNVLVAIAQERDPNRPPAFPNEANMRTEFEAPFGTAPVANTGYGLLYSRHMYEYGTTHEQLANIAANQRFNALENPNSAFQGQPITKEDVVNSRWVNYPIHLLECVMPCGGGAAVIVTSAERAKAFSANRPVYLLGAGVGLDAMVGWQHEKLTQSPVVRSAPKAYEMSGYGPMDIQFAEFYD